METKPFDFCRRCSLQNHSVYVPIWIPEEHNYRRQLNILFVGQNPGLETESVTKIPFTGKAGKMFFRLLKEAGLNKSFLPTTNLISCPTPLDRLPSSSEIECCSPRLKAEIHDLQPDLIIALGKPAAVALCGKFDRGNFLHLLPRWDYDCEVLTTYHPSFVMRQRQWIDIIIKDFRQIHGYLAGTLVQITKESVTKHFMLNPNESELAEFLHKASQTTSAYDIETTGLDIRRDELTGIGFGFGKQATAVTLIPNSPLWEPIDAYLQDSKAKKIHQNGQFDSGFIYEKRGYHVRGVVFDPMLAGQLLHSDLPNNLQDLRCTYTDLPSYKRSRKEIKSALSQGGSVTNEECCWDVITTLAVAEKMKALLTPQELELKQTLLLPLVPIINEIEHKGVLVDQRKLAELFVLGRRALTPMEKVFDTIDLNPNSPVQIIERWGLKDSREETLEALIKRSDPNSKWFQLILDYRKLAKLEGTFLRGVYERLINGRIHTHFKLDGTGTGRLASENPNLQNVPPEMRAIYIPDDDGSFFAEGDFKALELRVIGLIAPEPKLLEKLATGIDPHSEVHKLCYPDLEEETHESRLRAKAIVFGTIGGRGAISIAREFGISVQQAEQWQAHCISTYPGFIRYKLRCEAQLRDQGFITTRFGRRRYVTAITQGYNSPMQSTAADVTLTTLLRLHRAGFDLRVTVHDSFVCQVRSRAEAEELKRIAETPFEILDNYSFPATVKMGRNWFDIHSIEKMREEWK